MGVVACFFCRRALVSFVCVQRQPPPLANPQNSTPSQQQTHTLHSLHKTTPTLHKQTNQQKHKGNEFGHPEWLDFPREGNAWSHHHARRQWSLADADHLRYGQLRAWDAALNAADDECVFFFCIVLFAAALQSLLVAVARR
jgi:hypothetical protein